MLPPPQDAPDSGTGGAHTASQPNNMGSGAQAGKTGDASRPVNPQEVQVLQSQIMGLLKMNNQFNSSLGGYNIPDEILAVMAGGCAVCAVKYGLSLEAKPEVVAAATAIALPGQSLWLILKRKREEQAAKREAAEKARKETMQREAEKDKDPRTAYEDRKTASADLEDIATKPNGKVPTPPPGTTQKIEGGIIISKPPKLSPEELGDNPETMERVPPS